MFDWKKSDWYLITLLQPQTLQVPLWVRDEGNYNFEALTTTWVSDIQIALTQISFE